jgi:hypothetical protein
MSRWWTLIKEECQPIRLDSEALWGLIGVLSLTLIFQLIERGYV